MHKTQVPVAYVERLNQHLSGHPLDCLSDLFAPGARVERYLLGEQPRVYYGIEQIEEMFLRLPPVGGSFQVTDVQVEADTIHARFHTRDFPYPMRGTYRFELDSSGRVARLYISACYSKPAGP